MDRVCKKVLRRMHSDGPVISVATILIERAVELWLPLLLQWLANSP